MNEKSTFIKLNRKILKWRWYQDANTFRVFVHLLLTANVYDNDFKTIKIKRGQTLTSYSKLAEELGFIKNKKLQIQTTRTAINHLKSTHEITVGKKLNGLIITIKNYDDYQKITHNSTYKQQTANTQLTHEQQQYKKVKNIKKVKKEREGIKFFSPTPSTHHFFGEFKNVKLTDEELNSLKEKYPIQYKAKIERLSSYIATSGKNYNSHYAVLLQWLAEDLAKGEQRGGKSKGSEESKKGKGYMEQEPSYDIDELESRSFFDEELK